MTAVRINLESSRCAQCVSAASAGMSAAVAGALQALLYWHVTRLERQNSRIEPQRYSSSPKKTDEGFMNISFENKVALVTGAASGLGFATA